MADIHTILFNAIILFSLMLAIWAAVLAGRGESLSGNYWGAVATFVILVALTTGVGLLLALQGLRPRDGRVWLYFLYMLFLLVIMPGLFSLLSGRDDRTAGFAFAVLAFFNASVGFSMQQRELIGPWVELP